MTLADRLASKYEPEPNSGCWLWTGAMRGARGSEYGHMRVDARHTSAHRVSVWLRDGVEPPADRVVMHRCDNRYCVNPEHLVVGTQADNIADCITKGRNSPPPKGARAILTRDQVKVIRKRHLTRKEYAAMYKVSLGAIDGVLYGRNWRSI